MRIGIIGGGFVGKATRLLECNTVEVYTYDINKDLCNPKDTTMKTICDCDLIFICVPTPMNKNGSCYINIVLNVLEEIKKYIKIEDSCVILRSTLPVNTSHELNCYFMPEFLTEKNFEDDFRNNKNWIIGLREESVEREELFKGKFSELINNAYENESIKYNNIHFMSNSEAEMVKLFRNNFLAVKVSFCNEMYRFCESANISYENVRKVAVLDNRIGSSHSNVPGHDGNYGYGGTCFPKDTHSLYHQMSMNGVDSRIIRGAIERNELIDRRAKDWESNKGRAVV